MSENVSELPLPVFPERGLFLCLLIVFQPVLCPPPTFMGTPPRLVDVLRISVRPRIFCPPCFLCPCLLTRQRTEHQVPYMPPVLTAKFLFRHTFSSWVIAGHFSVPGVQSYIKGSSSSHKAASRNFPLGRHEYLHPYLSRIRAKSL